MSLVKKMLENRLQLLRERYDRLQRRIKAQEYLNRKAMEDLRKEEDELRIELAAARANLRHAPPEK